MQPPEIRPDRTPATNSASAPKPSRLPWIIVLAILAFACVPLYFMWNPDSRAPEAPPPLAKATEAQAGPAVPPPPAPSANGPVIDVRALEGQPADGEQARRRERFGLDKSMDVVARSDETLRIGQKEVAVSDVKRKLTVQSRGEVSVESLENDGDVSAWGFHIVRPNENLWNIHLGLLRDYLAARGIDLLPKADEPTEMGYSSGVGRTLKFAEHMVGVYNVQTGNMSRNLNTLEPGQKMVVVNLSELFGQLAKISPEELARVRFDGRTLIIPADDASGAVGEGGDAATGGRK